MDGSFFDGSSAREQRVSVDFDRDQLRLLDGNGMLVRSWRLPDLQLAAAPTNHTRHLTVASAPGGLLVLRGADVIAQLRERLPRVLRFEGRQAPFWRCASLLALIAALMSGIGVAMPLVAQAIARRVPVGYARVLGSQLAAVIGLARCSNPQGEAALTALANRLGEGSGQQFDVKVVKMLRANVFAFPDGSMLVTTGMLRGTNAAELAGVLAHEIEHVVQRHVLERALDETLQTALWTVIIGEYAELIAAHPWTANRVAYLQYSQNDERAADEGAVVRLHRAGLSHIGLADFFDRYTLEADGMNDLTFLASHPGSLKRRIYFRDIADVPASASYWSEIDVARIRAACPVE